MTQTAWDDLPNAKLIDQVLVELRANPAVFIRAWSAAPPAARVQAWSAAAHAARVQVWSAVWSAARSAAWNAAWDAAWDAARSAANDAAWNAAWDAISALIAHDDAGKYLDMSPEELRTWAILSEHPATVLLLPYVWVREQLSKARA